MIQGGSMSVSESSTATTGDGGNVFGSSELCVSKNGESVRRAAIPMVPIDAFRRTVVEACARGARITALFPITGAAADGVSLLVVLADDRGGRLGLLRGRLPDDRCFASLTPELPQAQLYERELFEEHGIEPVGHPWLKPVRRHADLETTGAPHERPAPPHEFFRVEGEGIHEVAVGPVHAGVIEPGHFRFQCYGETVLSLEIQLGYQRRGAERLLIAAPPRRMAVAETIAGDTSIGHGTAYCLAMEALGGALAPSRAQAVRAIALELERCANHVGDLGALCNDVGYLPGASWFGRLRGEFLNLSAELCGSRFGRGLLKVGGVRFDVPLDGRAELVSRLEKAYADLEMITDLASDTPPIGSRFEQTGIVVRQLAEAIGLVGPAARASGCDRDARRDHPTGLYREVRMPVALLETGDVWCRARIRRLESENAIRFILAQLPKLEEGPLEVAVGAPAADHVAVALVEGWRGEVVHVAVTDAAGALAAYKVVDPSFHNWFGLALALRENQISDFPLCNKSFNLSYAGHDL
jgi:Ni,Fe-hydrogenase III large subunit